MFVSVAPAGPLLAVRATVTCVPVAGKAQKEAS
jgi:hypothetical protein